MGARGDATVTDPAALHARVRVRRDDFLLETQLECRPGETLVVLGPNGSGKSTLLRALAGLTAIDEGLVTLGPETWDDGRRFLAPQLRRAGTVFQDHRLFPHLSVLENVAFGPRATGTPRRDARRQAADQLHSLGLGHLSSRRPRELSGGQSQAVGIARVLASSPRALLFDEPLAALDAGTRHHVRGLLAKAVADAAVPVVLITHDPVDALTLASNILVLEGGQTSQVGSPLDVAARPQTAFVAELMGLNLLHGRVLDPTVGSIDVAGTTLVATGDAAHAPVGTAVLVSVPPNAITLFRERPEQGSARNVWQGTVDRAHAFSDRARVWVTSTPSVMVDVTPAAVQSLSLTEGDCVWLMAKATEMAVYADTGPDQEPLGWQDLEPSD